MSDLENLKAEWIAAEQTAWDAYKEAQRLKELAEKARDKYRAAYDKEGEKV